MKVLVVGGAGYIGSHVVRELLDKGFDPLVLDNLSSGHRWAVPPGRLYECDLGNHTLLNTVFESHAIDVVMHFASYIQVGESVLNPIKYYMNNVGNTIHLLNAMQQHGVNKIVFSSSAAVYGAPEVVPILENSLPSPQNPYGFSKLMVEQMLTDCEKAWGLKHSILRYFNAAGAHQSGEIGESHDPETHIIPLLIHTALGLRESITIFGNDYPTPDGTNVRDYIHVSDIARAHVLALASLNESGRSSIYNLGNGIGFSNLELINVVKRITGVDFNVKIGMRRQGDPASLVASSDLIATELGWSPRYDLDSIVTTAYQWHKKQVLGC